MEIEIFEKKENVLFDRTEVKFYVFCCRQHPTKIW